MPSDVFDSDSWLFSAAGKTENAQIWRSWNVQYTSAIVSAASTAISYTSGTSVNSENDAVWSAWNQITVNSTDTCGTCNNIWVAWNEDYESNIQYVRPRIQTPEEIAAAEAAAAVAHRQRRHQRAVQRLAKRRAEKLLEDHLTPEQSRDLQRWGFFKLYVQKDGQNKVYRIRRGSVQNIDLVEELPSGLLKPIKTLCIHPVEQVPDADTMLIQKMLLESDEDQLLKIANHMAPVPGALNAPQTERQAA